jgi:hypothetical protein
MKLVFLCICWIAVVTPAAAVENDVIPGEWAANESGIFIVPNSDASEPLFLYGNCLHESLGFGGPPSKSKLNLDVEHKWIGPIIEKGDYIVARFLGTGPSLDLWVDSVFNNEASTRTGWSSRFEDVSRKDWEYLAKSQSLSLAIGDRPSGAEAVSLKVHYTLPEKNRATAINAFIKSCFKDETPGPNDGSQPQR